MHEPAAAAARDEIIDTESNSSSRAAASRSCRSCCMQARVRSCPPPSDRRGTPRILIAISAAPPLDRMRLRWPIVLFVTDAFQPLPPTAGQRKPSGRAGGSSGDGRRAAKLSLPPCTVSYLLYVCRSRRDMTQAVWRSCCHHADSVQWAVVLLCWSCQLDITRYLTAAT